MIGQTISHYPAVRDPAKRDKILEKLGEVRLSAEGGGRELVPNPSKEIGIL